ncbi:D-alanyl-lipoteichoic acid acyltransferase DltB, MBOAT superfamily [Neptunomonas antarctica]|uniref:Probable alginate O-acetylase n=2 Tax=Neptunomonas antarctica TaxID=619304 RepID=A0A1N7JEU6_9GAMM|nr:D-alanyl-lipoteichoic acid acyltransferase DltB, MBOAT superfamily [Neptunomonas antarctica]
MLFNSYTFIFAYLPLTMLIFFAFSRLGNITMALTSLVACSLFFYGWWNPAYLGLIVVSIGWNYFLGRLLEKDRIQRKALLWLGIVSNIAVLGYFKYANFFVENLNLILVNDIHLETVVLPLAISFFTFQQVAYLVDAYRGETKEHSFLHYCLFVTFFPQLIAGPIVHHKEMLPQFSRPQTYQLQASNIAIGMTIFFIGLFKKVIIADGFARWGSPVFGAADAGQTISLLEAWAGALSYTLQLYFDFSGYSDMAVGLARLFGIKLPINFFSPYRALNISDFWRRWHMTLSRFLRDYLYISLGGNRKGPVRRYTNLMATMVLGGIWHGAGWNFFIWGGLHGCYLVIHQLWQATFATTLIATYKKYWFYRFLAWLITMLVVVVGWVFFRAASFDGAVNILSGMFAINGCSLPEHYLIATGSVGTILNDLGCKPVAELTYFYGLLQLATLVGFMLVVVWWPNTYELMGRYRPAYDLGKILYRDKSRGFWQWRVSRKWAAMTAIVALIGILALGRVSEFIYFQF